MIEIPEEQAKALLDYLMTRPYGEVATAVGWLAQAIEQAEQAKQEKP